MSKRIRLAGVTVQVQVFVDDGENLTPAQVAPLQLTAEDWAEFASDGMERVLADLQAQVEE